MRLMALALLPLTILNFCDPPPQLIFATSQDQPIKSDLMNKG
jgi:hypothetical protein